MSVNNSEYSETGIVHITLFRGGRNFRRGSACGRAVRRLVISVVEVVEGGARTVETPETPGRIARGIDTSVIPASPTLPFRPSTCLTCSLSSC